MQNHFRCLYFKNFPMILVTFDWENVCHFNFLVKYLGTCSLEKDFSSKQLKPFSLGKKVF